MFFLSKFITLLPVMFLSWLGQPFRFVVDSNLRNLSKNHIEDRYSEKKVEHYLPRFFFSGIAMILTIGFVVLTWTTGGILLLIFPVILLILGSVDAMLILARYINHQETLKKYDSSTALTLQDHWKDSSLNAILKRREDEITKWRVEYKERTGREPTDADVRYHM